ncbi:helix-turn-helix domain-containing protein [Paenibacillus nicotianae]|uniref:Helix-turn-helix domain-containing protein n=1 Tax=Paenibacillus nicotianae TaxID=1526551 RepID=A0ABW4ULI7_9BACL
MTKQNLSFFDEIKLGLEQAIDYEQGNTKSARQQTISVKPLESYSKEDIKRIRLNMTLTQKTFAQTIGVSVKTIEAWERGINSPNGSASRLLELMDQKPDVVKEHILK